MAISKTMQTALNKQISAEFTAFYQYLAMHAFFVEMNLEGFAAWMHAQSHEELGHAEKLLHYVHERGGNVALEALPAPRATWRSPLHAIQDALAHEQKVTKSIYALVEKATKEKDHATEIFLQWYVTEQVEEEASVDRVVQRMKLAGDSPTGLLIIDREMGARSAQSGGR